MATYYVSAAGNDSNAGTSTGAPWLTIGKVNTVGLTAGDSVSFRGGDTFTGSLLVDPASQPGPTTRITATSYGTGKATINCGDSYGVQVLNTGYVTVSNLITSGSGIVVTGTYPNKDGTTTSTTGGVLVTITTTGTWYGGLIIDGIEATGSLFGIYVLSTDATATAALENWRISNCNAHHCGVAGIFMRGTGTAPGEHHQHSGILFRYGYIVDCQSTYNPGITNYNYDNPGYTYWSGFGIFPYSCSYTMVDRCYVTQCGDASYNAGGGGPVGIIFVESDHCTIRRCEGAYVYATSGNDGNAFDFDINATNCVLEYCYGHDCDGSGILLYNTSSASIVRYNIIENCGRTSQAGCVRDLASDNSQFYNNIFFHSKAASGPAGMMICGVSGLWRNNIFSCAAGATFGDFFGSTLTGNTYHVGSGSTFSLIRSSTTYTSLSGMQAASLEKIGSRAVGASGDPVFLNAGVGATCLPTSQVSQLVNYDLGVGSVAQGAGVNLLEFSITPPAVDWHNNPAVAGETSLLSGIDSGVARKGSTVLVGVVGVR